MNGQIFHDDSFRFSAWQIEVSRMNDRDFHDDV